MERVHEDSLLSPSASLPPPSTPPLMNEASPSPPAPPRPAAGRPVRCRLELGVLENVQAAESTPLIERDSAPPSRPESPDICCSQLRLQQYKEQIRFSRYPTPPDAPRKDQYISPSESESEAESLPPPIKVFHKGLLMYHKAHKAP